MLRISAAIVALGVFATGASAQSVDRAWVDGLIAQTGIPEQFENISDAGDLAARHLPSGLECHFGAKPIGRLTVFDNPDAPRGDDIGCNVHADAIVVSFAATRVRPAPALDDAAAQYFANLRGIYPNARPFTFTGGQPSVEFPNSRTPPVRITRFVFDYNGQPMFSRAATTVVGDWIVEERASAPLDLADPAEIFAQVSMENGLTAMVSAQRARR